MGILFEGLRLRRDEADRLREQETKKYLSNKKLLLILDLDGTLVDTCCSISLTPEEKYLENQIDSPEMKGSLVKWRFHDSHPYQFTKLRPFARTFLEEASKMFQLWIYTNGRTPYAMWMSMLLDPEAKYLNPRRVISRPEGSSSLQKSLDIVPGLESTIVIVDDSKIVWQKHRANLILIEKYDYFSGGKPDALSYSATRTDESENEGHLKAVLETLGKIHAQFFRTDLESDLAIRDVRCYTNNEEIKIPNRDVKHHPKINK